MEARKIRVAITHGDTNSIGYELIFKTFSESEMLDMCVPIVYGSPKVAAYHKKVMNTPAQFTIIHKAEDAMEGRLNLLAAIEDEVKVELGTATPESGTAAMKSLDRAMTDFRRGLFDVLVTTPVNKSNAQMAGYPFPGHTRFLETCVGEEAQAFNIYVNGKMRVASLTGMVPVNQVVESITEENVMAKVRTMTKAQDKVIEFIKSRGVTSDYTFIVAHVDVLDAAVDYAQKIQRSFNGAKIKIIDLVSAVGIHTGLGCLALQVFNENA